MNEENKDITSTYNEIEEELADSGKWVRRPQKKQKNFAWLIIALVVFVMLASYFSYSYFTVNNTVQPEETAVVTETPVEVGEYHDSEEITVLKKEASELFDVQIQAWFLQDPELETKVNKFEAKVTQIMEAIRKYYIQENHGTEIEAEYSLVDFLQKLEYEGVMLTQKSIPYYIEKYQSLGE